MWFEQTTPYMISRGNVQTGGERGQEAMGAGEGGGVSDTPPTARDRNDGWGSSIPDSRTGAFPAYPRSGRGLRYVSRFSIRCPLPRSTGHQAETRSSRRCANTMQPDAVSLSKETSKYGCQGEERETFGKKKNPQPVSNRPRRTQTTFFRRGGTSTVSYCALPAPPVSSGRPASRAAPSTNRSPAASVRGNMPDQLPRQSFQGKTPPIRWICNRLYLQIKKEMWKNIRETVIFLLTVGGVFTKQFFARWAIVQLAGRRILVPLIVVQVHVAQPTRTQTSPSSSRPRTAAFHAVNGGSNPPGDAKNFNRLQQLSFWVTKIRLQFFLRRPSLEEFLF